MRIHGNCQGIAWICGGIDALALGRRGDGKDLRGAQHLAQFTSAQQSQCCVVRSQQKSINPHAHKTAGLLLNDAAEMLDQTEPPPNVLDAPAPANAAQ